MCHFFQISNYSLVYQRNCDVFRDHDPVQHDWRRQMHDDEYVYNKQYFKYYHGLNLSPSGRRIRAMIRATSYELYRIIVFLEVLNISIEVYTSVSCLIV